MDQNLKFTYITDDDINILHALICLFTGFSAHPFTGGWHWVGVWNPAYDKAWLSLC